MRGGKNNKKRDMRLGFIAVVKRMGGFEKRTKTLWKYICIYLQPLLCRGKSSEQWSKMETRTYNNVKADSMG